jgi:NADH-quinone oxidoreductase subunit L
MVTAGIFLITRSSVLYHAAPLSSAAVTLIGSFTALVAGFIAMGQWDIKKVLAYSTVSQLGFMVAGVGLGGYSAGMFHLVTHAFFKALLFLGAGSVIHGVEHGHHHVTHEAHAEHGAHEEHADAAEEAPFDAQDMRNMGGLSRRMPITFWTYMVGTLALSGIFPLAGFWSKDEIIGNAFVSGFDNGKFEGFVALFLLIVAAGFTAFYMWRQIRLVFLGTARTEAAGQATESNLLMTVPLVVLAFLATFGGLLSMPLNFLGWPREVLTRWLEQSVPYTSGVGFNLLLAVTTLGIAVGALLLADRIYSPQPLASKNRDKLEVDAQTRGLFRLANAKLYWDEFYGRYFEQPYNRASVWLADTLDWKLWHDGFHNRIVRDNFNRAADFLSKPVDRGAIDQGFLSIGRGIQQFSARLRRTETGYVRTYVFTMLFGAVLIMLIILFPLIRQWLGQ